jgi:hypothetical protein
VGAAEYHADRDVGGGNMSETNESQMADEKRITIENSRLIQNLYIGLGIFLFIAGLAPSVLDTLLSSFGVVFFYIGYSKMGVE